MRALGLWDQHGLLNPKALSQPAFFRETQTAFKARRDLVGWYVACPADGIQEIAWKGWQASVLGEAAELVPWQSWLAEQVGGKNPEK